MIMISGSDFDGEIVQAPAEPAAPETPETPEAKISTLFLKYIVREVGLITLEEEFQGQLSNKKALPEVRKRINDAKRELDELTSELYLEFNSYFVNFPNEVWHGESVKFFDSIRLFFNIFNRTRVDVNEARAALMAAIDPVTRVAEEKGITEKSLFELIGLNREARRLFFTRVLDLRTSKDDIPTLIAAFEVLKTNLTNDTSNLMANFKTYFAAAAKNSITKAQNMFLVMIPNESDLALKRQRDSIPMLKAATDYVQSMINNQAQQVVDVSVPASAPASAPAPSSALQSEPVSLPLAPQKEQADTPVVLLAPNKATIKVPAAMEPVAPPTVQTPALVSTPAIDDESNKLPSQPIATPHLDALVNSNGRQPNPSVMSLPRVVVFDDEISIKALEANILKIKESKKFDAVRLKSLDALVTHLKMQFNTKGNLHHQPTVVLREACRFTKRIAAGDKIDDATNMFVDNCAAKINLSAGSKLGRVVALVAIAFLGFAIGLTVGGLIGFGAGSFTGPFAVFTAFIGMLKGAAEGAVIGATIGAGLSGIAAGTGAGLLLFKKNPLQTVVANVADDFRQLAKKK